MTEGLIREGIQELPRGTCRSTRIHPFKRRKGIFRRLYISNAPTSAYVSGNGDTIANAHELSSRRQELDMKDILSRVTFTAGAVCFVMFLTTLRPDSDLPESGFNPSTVTAFLVPQDDHGCRLRRPLLAESRELLDVKSHLRDS